LFAFAGILDGDVFEVVRPVAAVALNGHGWNVFEVFLGFVEIGDGDVFQGVHVKVAFGGDVGTMRIEESGGEEEGFVFLFFDLVDDPGGDHAVRVVFVFADGIPPGHGDAESPARPVFGNFVFLVFVDAFGVVAFIPGFWIVVGIGADLAGGAVVVDFASTGGVVTVFAKELAECHNIGILLAEFMLEGVHVERVGSKTGHQAGSTGTAEGLLAVG